MSVNKRRVYFICPVRKATTPQKIKMEAYVQDLETKGFQVHFPPRDVNQSNDDGGVRICRSHLKAMCNVHEVHVWWVNESSGCHFDLGMAFLLNRLNVMFDNPPIVFVIANPDEVPETHEKSFQNVLRSLVNGEFNTAD